MAAEAAARVLDDRRADPLGRAMPTDRRRGRDRRASPRVEVRLQCEDVGFPDSKMLQSEDLSVFGVCVRTEEPYKRGSRLLLELHLPDGGEAPLALRCEVVGWDKRRRRARLAFRDPPVRAVRRILRFLQTISEA